jgi:hypothetical protein
MMVNNNLVGGKTISLKNMTVSWDDGIPNRWKPCAKSPTSIYIYVVIFPLFLQNYSPNITPYSR